MRKHTALFSTLILLGLVGCESQSVEVDPSSEDVSTAENAQVAAQEDQEVQRGIPGFGLGLDYDETGRPEGLLDPGQMEAMRRSAPSQVEFDRTPYEGGHDLEVPVSARDYQAKMVENICLGFEECKNQELKMAAFSLFISTLAEHELTPEVDNNLGHLVRRLSQEQVLPNREDCELVFTTVLDVTHYSPESLERYLGNRSIAFDEATAGRCVGAFARPFALCALEREVTHDPNTEQFMLTILQHQEDLSEHFMACSEVIEGRLTEGMRCDAPFQCAGPQMHCAPEGRSGPTVCLPVPSAGFMDGIY